MLFPTLKKIGVKQTKNPGGGGVWIFFFRKKILSHFTFYAIFNITKKKYWKVPLHLLVKWEVVSPNSRGTIGIYIHYILYSLVLILYLQCGGGLGKKNLEYKTIISHLMFSSCFFLYAGNIVKCPFTYSYWLNGRWFLQIVDIGNFIMRLEILKSAPSLTG